ncbi:hypothetical protein FOCC_FOCC014945, partial [Frankliniella occidentalis]
MRLCGAWFTLIPTMRATDPDQFYDFFRVTPESFDILEEMVSPHLVKRSCVSEGERLAITLRYIASGDRQKSLSYLFRVSPQCISNIIFETATVIATSLEKGTHLLILMAVADAKYRFTMVDFGASGRRGDANLIHNSVMGRKLKNNRLRIPNACPAPGVTVVENAFGILVGRFQVLSSAMYASKSVVKSVTLCCIALHNWHLQNEESVPPKQRRYRPEGYADYVTADGKYIYGRWRNEQPAKEEAFFHKLK